ncbi:hypothetical protein CYLTODRAFT_448376 [Cylindrobasidium torrendii FP15055 ss-10]|uniref:Uncharacterized protein n=1 Tax=Cylindrobasidium torrendii FP15055 ss-10 TaxID=1314674 RepID=A0A0D7BX21_9AGAR|nr:hypothetical protein CYLTODRAFT_448376 [Cylindrobasidium torrendii FP15055 ss-10]
MSSATFLLSFVYYTFSLAFLEAMRAVLQPVCAASPVIPDMADLTEFMALAALAALALVALIIAVQRILDLAGLYAEEYQEVLSGLFERVIPAVTLACSIVAFAVFSSTDSPLGTVERLVKTTFSMPTFLYYCSFGMAVAHRINNAAGVFPDIETGSPTKPEFTWAYPAVPAFEHSLLFSHDVKSQL